jgi:hypothetical protein
MLPITLQTTIENISNNNKELFIELLTQRILTEESNPSFLKVKEVKPKDVIKAINQINALVPPPLQPFLKQFVEFHVIENPINNVIQLFPVFTAQGMLDLMRTNQLIKSYAISEIDAKDHFVFNGSREKVEHEQAKLPSNQLEGAYIQIIFPDDSVSVWTMTQHEVVEAKHAWLYKVFNNQYSFESESTFTHWVIFHRACKLLNNFFFNNEYEDLSNLFINTQCFYNDCFQFFNQNKHLINTNQKYRNVSNQPSELQNVLKLLPKKTETIDPKYKLPELCVSYEEDDEKEPADYFNNTFGVGGW